MEKTKKTLKPRIDEYFNYLEQIEKIDSKLLELDYNMQGVKGVRFDSVKGGNADREHTLLNLIEKEDNLIEERDNIEYTILNLATEIGINRLSKNELRILKYAHNGMTYERIADIMHYSGKVVIYRKIKSIYNKLKRDSDNTTK